jgi:hypothetical protein
VKTHALLRAGTTTAWAKAQVVVVPMTSRALHSALGMSRYQRLKETSVTSKTKSWLFLIGAVTAEVTGSLSLKAALDAPGVRNEPVTDSV